MQHIVQRVQNQIAESKEKFGNAYLPSVLEYVEKGLVFESNDRQYRMVSGACSQIALAAATEQYELIDGVINTWVNRIEARAEASQLELDYLGQMYATHENKGYKTGRDKLHSTPHIGLYTFKVADAACGESNTAPQSKDGKKREVARVNHTIKTREEMVEWFKEVVTPEQCHWMGIQAILRKMEVIICKFIHDNPDTEGYLIPKVPERDKLGRMRMAPILRAYFWASLAAKQHVEPEGEGKVSYAQYVRNRLNKVQRDIEEMDAQCLEPGHYLTAALEEAQAKVDDVEFKETVAPLKDLLWAEMRKFNKIAEWGAQFWDKNNPIQISEYPEQSDTAERDLEEVLALMGRKEVEHKQLTSLYQELLKKAEAA